MVGFRRASAHTRYLPDGFTVHDGAGQWLNPSTGNIVRERTKILTVASERPRPDLKDRLTAITEAYRSRFRQQSVGVITRTPAPHSDAINPRPLAGEGGERSEPGEGLFGAQYL
jgi:hypothetical protein